MASYLARDRYASCYHQPVRLRLKDTAGVNPAAAGSEEETDQTRAPLVRYDYESFGATVTEDDNSGRYGQVSVRIKADNAKSANAARKAYLEKWPKVYNTFLSSIGIDAGGKFIVTGHRFNHC